MSYQQITISLPERLYQQVEKLSQAKQRSVAEEVVAIVSSALPDQEDIHADLKVELAHLDQLSDEELWRAARVTAPVEKTDRMQILLDKQQLEGLTAVEREEAELLAHFFDRIMLVRARASALLKSRGHDITSLLNESNA